MSDNTAHAPFFQDAQTQRHAARFGMWVFLSSESLLFAGLFALYASYRAAHPEIFAAQEHHNNKVFGTLNTAVLICSSFSVALAVYANELKRRIMAALCIVLTLMLAGAFLVIKGFEYAHHFEQGIFPGGRGAYFDSAPPSATTFWNLYYGLTGLHALHVLIGMSLLGWMLVLVLRQKRSETALECSALYWHLVDLIWIFLWPLFYLTGHAGA